ncbi:TPR repeat-containing thioredoxin TDX isoform X1 [Glycine max]|uniref:TPR repeat-containing thioredoxin TDX isoform X1 n=1 Tax=Glycine max TaxID=3847 RepID=UPI001B35487E|nr:TPR repeat-containing thioredoxin TDX isoform X1 [Glycine max]
MEEGKLRELKQFIEICKSNPSLLHNPSLSFFKTYLLSLGARIPPQPKTEPGDFDDKSDPPLSAQNDIVESDIELDNADVVEPDNDPPQKMGDPSAEITEEQRDAAQLAKSKAVDAMSQGNLDEALAQLTEAILLNPQSAILYATRGTLCVCVCIPTRMERLFDKFLSVALLFVLPSVSFGNPNFLFSASIYMKLKKPNAAIRDADTALKINPDSAKGYKIRGMSRAMLGLWEEAASDLHVASKLDYDEEISMALKKVEPNALKIEEHRRKYERLRKQKQQKRAPIKTEAPIKKEQETEAQVQAALSALKDGQVMGIHSSGELEKKLSAASKTSRLAILYFTATWCGPCRFISPIYTSLAEKYPKVVFLKVDIDEARDVAAGWNISSVPTFFFVKNGKEVDSVVGADKSTLESKIAQHAGSL